MLIKCAWCDRIVGEKEGKGITHTICDECLKKLTTGENTAKLEVK